MDATTDEKDAEQSTLVLASNKAIDIIAACDVAERSSNIESLVDLAISDGGLLQDSLRQRAWPLLLGLTASEKAVSSGGDWKSFPSHRDEEQVLRDVDRSFVYYPTDRSAPNLARLRESLSNLIISILRTYPELCYFQGYHDVATVLLLALGESDARPALARLSLLRIRDFMLPTLTGAVIQLHLVPALLRQSDPDLAQYLPPDPFYALSATLTLFSHLVGDYPSIARTFDFLLATPATAPVYLYVAAIRSRRHELEELDPHDYDMLHFTLTKLPQDMDFDELVRDAQKLLTKFPPKSLGPAWKRVPGASALRTASTTEDVREQTLEEAEHWRQEQVLHSKSMERREKLLRNAKMLMRRYRRPLSLTAGSAVAIALLAVVLARTGEGRYGFGGIMGSVWRTLGGLPL